MTSALPDCEQRAEKDFRIVVTPLKDRFVPMKKRLLLSGSLGDRSLVGITAMTARRFPVSPVLSRSDFVSP